MPSKFKYQLELYDKNPDRYYWCVVKLTQNTWEHEFNNKNLSNLYKFENKEDFVLFKLTWKY